MKLHLLALAAPLCSALAIQNILSDLEGIENKLFDSQPENPLDDAIESSPTFFPAEIVDDTEIDRYSINTDPSAWIKHVFDHPFPKPSNTPPGFIGLDLNPDAELSLDTYPHHSDKTIYELISESKYTTILTKIINEDPELVQFLNSTEHKFTIFAPTDTAFKKIPHHHHHHRDHDGDGYGNGDGDGDGDHRIPKEIIRLFARYHSSPEVLNAAKLFHRHTIPSALHDPLLGGTNPGNDKLNHEEGLFQRLAVRSGFKGLTLNFYSHIVAADIGASNGLIHGIDSLLIPPPSALVLIDILPTKFSTFNLALHKTSLEHYLNTTAHKQEEPSGKGFTLFVPSNHAFEHLGLKINAFLFSPHGTPYLAALLKYHIVPGETLYSDVLYTGDGKVKPFGGRSVERYSNSNSGSVDAKKNGFTHVDLPTLLGDREIAVDVEHWGPYVGLKVNGRHRVGFADVLTKDGVIHVLEHVLIPPKRLDDLNGRFVVDDKAEYGEMEIEDFKERLRPWVDGKEEDVNMREEFWGVHGDL
ncbi:Fasciclin domain-containing protein [Aspergillus unguis]